MPASIEFRSVAPGQVQDHTRLFLIHKELRSMAKRQESMHMMDSDPHLLSCIEDLIDRINEYEDYDPTPDHVGEPPMTMDEMHTAAWNEHQRLHS